MMYTHDPWASFGFAAVYEVVKELSVVLSVQLDMPWIRLKRDWGSGEMMYNMFTSISGITVAILVLWVLVSPRLIRNPYQEAYILSREYDLEIPPYSNMYKYKMKQYSYLRLKYWIQLTFIQYVPPYVSMWLDNGSLIRRDFIVYIVLNYVLLYVFFIGNWTQKIEKEVIWKGDRKKYMDFYVGWLSVLVAFSFSMIYLYSYPKIVILTFSIFLLGILLFYLLFLMFKMKKKHRL